MPKVEKQVFLTQAELKALFDAVKRKGSRRDLAMFLLAYRHGLRASEVGLLRVSDLDLRSGHIHVIRLKGSVSGRQLLYPDEIRVVKAYLRERKDGSDVLFPSNRGTPISRWQVNKLMHSYAELAGIHKRKRHFHVLKHTMGTHLADADEDIRFIQEVLGHKNIQNTRVYSQLTSSSRDRRLRRALSSPKIVKV